MKRVFKLIILSFAVLLSLLVISCGGGTEEPEAKKTYKVMISYTEGATVFGTNPLTVEEGYDAVFDIEIADGYVYVSSEGAVSISKTASYPSSTVRGFVPKTVAPSV